MLFIYDDNFLTEEEINTLDTHYHDHDINWHYFPTTQGKINHPNVVQIDGIVDPPYFGANPPVESIQYIYSKYIIDKFVNKYNIKYDSIGRIKFNMLPLQEKSQTLYPHNDTLDPHYIFLYYINDADGDTVLYNEMADGSTYLYHVTESKRISPKKGSAFLVDGRYFHAMTTPSFGPIRKVINSNLMIQDWPKGLANDNTRN